MKCFQMHLCQNLCGNAESLTMLLLRSSDEIAASSGTLSDCLTRFSATSKKAAKAAVLFKLMHLLYADESGTISDPTQGHFVLARVAVFERTTHWIEARLNKIAARFSPDNPYLLELHGSPMRSGSTAWRHIPTSERRQAMIDALRIFVCNKHFRDARLFAVVLEKCRYSGQDIAQIVFEQLSSRFDHFIARLFREKNDKQRGMVLFDNSSTEARIQTLAREFKNSGHSFGVTRSFAEVAVFLDSRASRLIQLADLVAFAILRKFGFDDELYCNVIRDCFDTEGSVQHGLYVR